MDQNLLTVPVVYLMEELTCLNFMSTKSTKLKPEIQETPIIVTLHVVIYSQTCIQQSPLGQRKNVSSLFHDSIQIFQV